MPVQRLVTSQEFIRMTNMDSTQFFLLYETAKLPIVRIDRHVYIDVNDVRAQRHMPNYKKQKACLNRSVESPKTCSGISRSSSEKEKLAMEYLLE
jgi:hypothetical protein